MGAFRDGKISRLTFALFRQLGISVCRIARGDSRSCVTILGQLRLLIASGSWKKTKTPDRAERRREENPRPKFLTRGKYIWIGVMRSNNNFLNNSNVSYKIHCMIVKFCCIKILKKFWNYFYSKIEISFPRLKFFFTNARRYCKPFEAPSASLLHFCSALTLARSSCSNLSHCFSISKRILLNEQTNKQTKEEKEEISLSNLLVSYLLSSVIRWSLFIIYVLYIYILFSLIAFFLTRLHWNRLLLELHS